MPGLAGIISRDKTRPLHGEILTMVRSMKHEAFYKSGTLCRTSLGLQLGWVSHPTCFGSDMPAIDPTGGLILIFHGEDFPTKSTRNELFQTGYRGQFQSFDYLLHLYKKIGDDFLTRLNGWFSGVLLDLEKNRILLFNDRYGMQRIYLYDDGDAFYFATEAKCLLGLFPRLRQLEPESVAEYVSFDCVFGTKTLFRGVSLLPGGSCWSFDEGGVCRPGQYFGAGSIEADAPVDEKHIFARLQETFFEIVPRYAEPNQEVALSLTGGLDSRFILAALRDRARILKSYTFGGDRDTLDIRQSQKLARQIHLYHDVLRLESTFFHDFPDLVEQTVFISDGMLGASGAHNLYFNRLARQVAPIRLTGKFGSEVLRRNRILPQSKGSVDFLSSEFRELLPAARRRAEAYRRGHPLTLALFRDIPWREHGVVTIEQSQITLRSPFMDNDLVEIMYSASDSIRQSKRLQLRLIEALSPEMARIFTDRGDARGMNTLLIGFCRTLFWVLFKLDYVYYFDAPDWMTRWEPMARAIGLPQVVTGHQKFEHYRHWYQGPLAEHISSVLLDPRTLQRPLFDAGNLKRIVEQHLAGRADHQTEISKALSLEVIARSLLCGAPNVHKGVL